MRFVPVILATLVATTLLAQSPPPPYATVRDSGILAHVYRPHDAAKSPAVLLVGGSGGGIGWQDEMATLLSERRFVVMALAYFGMDDLPKELERIPLEYFDRALAWLKAQPYVDPTRIGIGGVSKGGELGLLIASRHPEISGVAVFVPSGVVFQSIASGYPHTSSWTYQGKDLPFVAYGKVENPKNTAEIYRAGIEQADSLEAATIPVERIRGPILLLSGQADNLWPSTMLSEMVVKRLREHNFKYSVEHIAYPNAGHLISSIRTDDVTRRGGTADGNHAAQADGQRRFLDFFVKNLKAR
jgi:dienelactone hydrolase